MSQQQQKSLSSRVSEALVDADLGVLDQQSLPQYIHYFGSTCEPINIEKQLPTIEVDKPVTMWLETYFSIDNKSPEFQVKSKQITLDDETLTRYRVSIPHNLVQDLFAYNAVYNVSSLIKGYIRTAKHTKLRNDLVSVLNNARTINIGAIQNYPSLTEDVSNSVKINVLEAIAKLNQDPQLCCDKFMVCGPYELLNTILNVDIFQKSKHNWDISYILDDRFDKIYVFPTGANDSINRSAVCIFGMEPWLNIKYSGDVCSVFVSIRQKIETSPLLDTVDMIYSIDYK